MSCFGAKTENRSSSASSRAAKKRPRISPGVGTGRAGESRFAQLLGSSALAGGALAGMVAFAGPAEAQYATPGSNAIIAPGAVAATAIGGGGVGGGVGGLIEW